MWRSEDSLLDQLLSFHCVGAQGGAWRPGQATGFVTLEPYFFFFFFKVLRQDLTLADLKLLILLPQPP